MISGDNDERQLPDSQTLSREAALCWIRERWGWQELAELICYQSTPAQYVARLMDGRIVDLGPADTVLSQTAFRRAIFRSTQTLVQWVDSRYWDEVVRKINAASISMEAPESEESDWLLGILEAYLDRWGYLSAREADAEVWSSRCDMSQPLIFGDRLCISATHLAEYTSNYHGEKISPRAMAMMLLKRGAVRSTIQLMWLGTYKFRRYWQLPDNLLPEHVRDSIAEFLRDVVAMVQPAATSTTSTQQSRPKMVEIIIQPGQPPVVVEAGNDEK